MAAMISSLDMVFLTMKKATPKGGLVDVEVARTQVGVAGLRDCVTTHREYDQVLLAT